MRIVTVMALGLALTAPVAQAFSPDQDPVKVLAAVPAMDCQKQPAECRYVAAVEVAAYAEACPGELVRFDPEGAALASADFRAALGHWKALDAPGLREAVMAPGNKLRTWLSERLARRLRSLPVEEVAVECARLVSLEDQVAAEGLSSLVMTAKKPPACVLEGYTPYAC